MTLALLLPSLSVYLVQTQLMLNDEGIVVLLYFICVVWVVTVITEPSTLTESKMWICSFSSPGLRFSWNNIPYSECSVEFLNNILSLSECLLLFFFRQLAIKALNDRLNATTDSDLGEESHWPGLVDEEEAPTVEIKDETTSNKAVTGPSREVADNFSGDTRVEKSAASTTTS